MNTARIQTLILELIQETNKPHHCQLGCNCKLLKNEVQKLYGWLHVHRQSTTQQSRFIPPEPVNACDLNGGG